MISNIFIYPFYSGNKSLNSPNWITKSNYVHWIDWLRMCFQRIVIQQVSGRDQKPQSIRRLVGTEKLSWSVLGNVQIFACRKHYILHNTLIIISCVLHFSWDYIFSCSKDFTQNVHYNFLSENMYFLKLLFFTMGFGTESI